MARKVSWTDSAGIEHEAKRGDIFTVPPEMIPGIRILFDVTRSAEIDPNDAEDEQFIRSIAATDGNMEPCLARKDSAGIYSIFDGRRRHGATAVINGDVERWHPAGPVPLRIEVLDVTEEEALKLSYHANLHKPMSPIDRAKVARHFARMFSWTNEEVGEEMHLSASAVGYLVGLLEFPQPVVNAIHKGALTPAAAQLLRGLPIQEQVGAIEQLEGGTRWRDIAATLRVKKRESRSKEGRPTPLTQAELKAILEASESNRATALLNALRGLGSASWEEILSDDAFDFRAAKVA